MSAPEKPPGVRAVKGMNDVLPGEIEGWQAAERLFARTVEGYGFREVRTPYVEPTRLFVRAIGEVTDIVEKEMYSFEHHDDQLTLRPEGTAGAARAYVEHQLHGREPATRWWYGGAMFRAERPQRGRYRQFYQLGAEIFGEAGPGCDAEMIDMLVVFLRALGIADARVLVNSMGGPGARTRYRDALVAYLEPRREELSPNSQRRLTTNPLRILDSKDPRDHAVLEGAPLLTDSLEPADQEHFAGLQAALCELGTPHEVTPRLVRGLDYYTRTIFEIKGASDKLGAGDTLVAGGRYDDMIGELGGPSTPALGFAAGLERLLIAAGDRAAPRPPVVYVATLGSGAVPHALVLARDLRQAGVEALADTRGASLKSQLRRANGMLCPVAAIVGEAEVARGVVQLKDLAAHAQEDVPRAEVVSRIAARLGAGGRAAPQGSE